jgi:hypothetical protein
MLAQEFRVLPNDLLVRRIVDAEGFQCAVPIDDDVAVLPGDLREVLVDELTRATADRGHFLLGDREAPDDEVARQALIVDRNALGE